MDELLITKSDIEANKRGYTFDLRSAEKVRNFFSKHIRHTKDRFAKKPFDLLEWQWEKLVKPMYGWKSPSGQYRFTEIKVGIPKKNGKSTLAAAMALEELVRGVEGNQTKIVAGDRKQASIIFNEAADMVERSPTLSKTIKVARSKFEMRYDKKQSTLEALSSDTAALGSSGKTSKEGLNPTLIIFDELHTQPNRHMWNTLKYAGAARECCRRIWLSTAGELDESSLWFQEFEVARKVLRGELIDTEILALIYEAEESDKWDDLETFIKCNPSYGHIMTERTVLKDIAEAQRNQSDELIYKRYRLNRAQPKSASWLSYESWLFCATEKEPEPQEVVKIYAGLDLSLNHDMSSMVVTKFVGDYRYIKPYFWLPDSIFNNRKHDAKNHERYKFWFDEGLLRLTTGLDVINYEQLADDIENICKLEGVQEVAIDRWNESRIAVELAKRFAENYNETVVSTISAASRNMCAATVEFERLIKSGFLKHYNNKILNWMFLNTAIAIAPNGNKQISKKHSFEKIDGIYATAITLAIDIDDKRKVQETKKKSKYEREGTKPFSFQ